MLLNFPSSFSPSSQIKTRVVPSFPEVVTVVKLFTSHDYKRNHWYFDWDEQSKISELLSSRYYHPKLFLIVDNFTLSGADDCLDTGNRVTNLSRFFSVTFNNKETITETFGRMWEYKYPCLEDGEMTLGMIATFKNVNQKKQHNYRPGLIILLDYSQSLTNCIVAERAPSVLIKASRLYLFQ